MNTMTALFSDDLGDLAMLLVVDIGNTNIVMALNDGKEWVANWRIYSDRKDK